MGKLFVLVLLAGLATEAGAATLCPDGSFTPGDSCALSYNGQVSIGGPPRLIPDSWYLARIAAGPTVAISALRDAHHHGLARVSRNPILDAPAGTQAIEIPRLSR